MEHKTRRLVARALLNAASVLSATTETRLKATLAKLDPLLQDLLVWIVFNAIGLESKVRKNGSMFDVSISPDGALDYDSVQSYSPTEVVDVLKEDLAKSSEVDAYVPWLGTKLAALMKSGGLSNKVQDDLIRGFRSIAIWAKETRTDIGKVSIEEALAQAKAHVPRAAKKGVDESDANPVVYRFPDGYKIVELKTDEALKHEGDRMDHCAGDYCEEVKSGRSVIYSLRSPDNDPEKDVTLEYNPESKSFVQILGYRNITPNAKQKKYLYKFVENNFPHNNRDLLTAGKPARDMDLVGADLRNAALKGADLADANLKDADLTNSDIREANLRGANLEGALLVGVYLQDANLTGAYLQGASLRDANLTDALLDGAVLIGAILTDANLEDADLRYAMLTNAKLEDAILTNAKLIGANLEGAKLYNANLTNANLTGANLTGANLYYASLIGIKYNDKTIWPDGFTPPPSA